MNTIPSPQHLSAKSFKLFFCLVCVVIWTLFLLHFYQCHESIPTATAWPQDRCSQKLKYPFFSADATDDSSSSSTTFVSSIIRATSVLQVSCGCICLSGLTVVLPSFNLCVHRFSTWTVCVCRLSLHVYLFVATLDGACTETEGDGGRESRIER